MHLSRFSPLLLLGVFVLSACSQAPEWRLNHGPVQSLNTLKGQWVLMNYWAEWCAPCIKEIPELNALDRDPGITVLAYNFDRLQGEPLAEQAQKLKIQFGLMLDEPAPLFDEARPQGLPATLVVNPQGNVVDWLVGPQTQASVRARLAELGQ